MKILVIDRDKTIYNIPDSSLVKGNKPVFLPEEEHSYELAYSCVFRVCRLGKHFAPRFAHRYVDGATAAFVLVDADLMKECRKEGLPWTLATGFDGAFTQGLMQDISDESLFDSFGFTLTKNGEEYSWKMKDYAPDWRDRLSRLSNYFTFKTGDLVLAGLSPSINVEINNKIKAIIDSYTILDCNIK